MHHKTIAELAAGLRRGDFSSVELTRHFLARIERLDPQRFVQVHRSVVVNLHAISHVTRGPNETADLHLKGRPEVLPVSRSYLHLFRQM